MDIYCKFCGEPWDHDELHYMEDRSAVGQRRIERGEDAYLPYAKAVKRFRKYGCGAWEPGASRCSHSMVNPDAALISEVSQELSDHPDDWAADASDLMYLRIR